MSANLYTLAQFFRTGRKPNGGFFGENEHVQNAVQRNLSLLSDAELLALRDSAQILINEINSEHQSRDHEPDAALPLRGRKMWS